MPFDFGGKGNPAPAPSGSGGGGFSFGTPAPSSAASGSASAPSFGFGSAAPSTTGASAPSSSAAFPSTPGPAPATTTFAFGTPGPSASSGAPAPSTTTGVSATPASSSGAPAPGAFSLNTPSLTSTNAPSGASGPAPAAGAFSFSSTTPAPASGSTSTATTAGAPSTTVFGSTAPAPSSGGGGFGGFGATSSSTLLGSNNNNNAPSAGPGAHLVRVPDYKEIFPGHVLWEKIEGLVKGSLRDDSMSGQELYSILSEADGGWASLLLEPQKIWKDTRTPNQNIRQQLAQQKEVLLRDKVASLSEQSLRDVIEIAEDLRLTETEALALYAEALSKPHTLEICAFARELYFFERSQFLKALLHLFQRRQEAEEDSFYLRATDFLLRKGLVKNLLNLIIGYSKQISGFTSQIKDMDNGSTSATFSSMSLSSVTDRRKHVVFLHWNYGMHERQRAAETLFFTTYNTQMEVTEIVDIIDTVQFLTNADNNWPGMPVLDPIIDAPLAQENIPGFTMSDFPFATTPKPDKDPMEWQKELISHCRSSGNIALLRCVSTLLLAGITAMDTKQEFIDRTTHAINQWGIGNSLLPPDYTGSLNHLDPIHAKLDIDDAASGWQRQDVFGVFVAAFGLLLRTAASALASPRGGPSIVASGSWSPPEIRRRSRANLETPTMYKTFTFLRLSVLPALEIPSTDETFAYCKIEEFAWEILGGWASQYLESLVVSPPISRAQWKKDAEDNLKIRQQDLNQQREFQQWSGTTSHVESVPKTVDLMERPDCMDDVVSFCAAIGAKGPAVAFWDIDSDMYPKNSLQTLEAMSLEDLTLRASFYELLATLAKAEYVDGEESESFAGATKINDMLSAEQQSQEVPIKARWTDILEVLRYYARLLAEKGQQATARNTSSSRTESTNYYYNATDPTVQFSRNSNSSTQPSRKSRELDESNIRDLGAALCLVECIASRSSTARSFLRNLKMDVESGGVAFKPLPSTRVLFALASSAIAPELRGLVFSVIASVHQDCSREEALEAWDLVESYGFLPIYKLQQFPTAINENDAPKLKFPPSATTRINEKGGKNWIPSKEAFSILYEMEYIEAARGSYPSTVGFLRTLSALVSAGGCPSNLGQNWRSRAGCSPYIEYSMLVLARAVGKFHGYAELPFASPAEKYKLCVAALEVVMVCASQYLTPDDLSTDQEKNFAENFRITQKHALGVIGLESLAKRVVAQPDKDDFVLFINDFLNGPSSAPGAEGEMSPNSDSVLPGQNMLSTVLPPPKSPGFTVLSAVLRNGQDSLFAALSSILWDGDTSTPAQYSDDLSMSHALFVSRGPSFEISKHGKSRVKLKPLLPPGLEESSSYSQSKKYHEKALAHVLQLICIVASKEEKFESARQKNGIERMVPTLRFNTAPSAPVVWDLQFSRISKKMEDYRILPCLASFLGNFADDPRLLASASVVLFLMKRSSEIARHKEVFSNAFTRLVSHLSRRSIMFDEYADIFEFILKCILREMEQHAAAPVLEFFTGPDAILPFTNAVSTPGFLVSEKSAKLAALCFEVVFHLSRKHGSSQPLKVFWSDFINYINSAVDDIEAGNLPKEMLLSMAWCLRGSADYIKSTVENPASTLFRGMGNNDLRETISLLCEQCVLENVARLLPVGKGMYSCVLSEGLHMCLGAIVVASSRTSSQVDLADIIREILKRLGDFFDEATCRNLSLSLYVAVGYSDMPPAPTAELAMGLGHAVVHVSYAKAVLVATLSLALRRLDPMVHGQAQHMEITSLTSGTLVQMACQVSDSTPPALTSEAMIARACLKLLWGSTQEPVVHRALVDSTAFDRKSTPLEQFIKLAGRADEDICSLLTVIAGLSFGSDQLVQSNVLVGLKNCATMFQQHVDFIESQGHQTADIAIPKWFQEHFRLILTILTRISENLLTDAALQAREILALYDPMVSRLLNAFPNEGETTVEYLKCVAVVQRASWRFAPPMDHGPQSLQYRTPSPDLGKVVSFVFHLAQNPLPRALLGPIPKALSTANTQNASGLVDVQVSEKSWWDELKKHHKEIQEIDVCHVGKTAAEMVAAGLAIVKKSSLLPRVDPASLSRSLIACSDAILWVDHSLNRFQNLTEELNLLREQLIAVVMDLLHISILIAQSLKHSGFDMQVSPRVFYEYVRSTMKRVNFDRISYSDRVGVDASSQDIVRDLASKLRECLP